MTDGEAGAQTGEATGAGHTTNKKLELGPEILEFRAIPEDTIPQAQSLRDLDAGQRALSHELEEAGADSRFSSNELMHHTPNTVLY